ncbi:Long-chain fatty acid transport protein 1 [Schistosoma japonicum]|nr:Long-chain fatty acid transport protein 1 [Schistosoma japonicum]
MLDILGIFQRTFKCLSERLFDFLCGCIMQPISWHPCFIFHLCVITLRLFIRRPLFESFITSYLLYVSFGGWRYQRVFFLTILRDLIGLKCFIMVRLSILWLQWTKRTFADMFKSTVKKRGSEKVAIYFENQVWTFGQLDAYSNKVANYLMKCGFKRGDILLLFMNSCPAYIGIWLGAAKAAIITKLRYALMVTGTKYSFGIRQSDIIYNPLPLYHTAGGICGVGQMLLNGNTIVIRSKFSASQFWSDCVKYNCTVAQYIGEICRYLLSQPVRPTDKQHHVRLAFGNGLRPQIWKTFQERFNVKQIGEFYGATESNANIANMDNKCGAVGYVSKIIDGIYPCYIIKIDLNTEEPVRDPDTGLCIICQPNEPGHLVARINSYDPFRMFDGYVNSEASKKKVIHNVLRKGDLWFASGDLMCCDELGYIYFIDRLGDTFRWHGENVSTAEVERVLDQAIGTLSGTVFGVSIPGTEGKAGMAAIALEGSKLNSEEEENLILRLNEEFTGNLPSYARPIFLRLCQNLAMTSTFKIRKTEISRLGFNPSTNPNDHIYFLNPKTKSYERVDEKIFEEINKGVFNF